MCKKNWKKVLEIILTTTLSFSMIVGCGAAKVPAPVPTTTEIQDSSEPQDCNESQATAEIHTSADQEISEKNQAMGAVLLSVNPEIEITYDGTGLVLKVEGLNEDGINVLAHMDDYLNQDCSTVIQKLVKEIYEAGYFENTIDGRDKNIILKLEEGSIAPSEDFLEEAAIAANETVSECGLQSKAMTVQESDLSDDGLISPEKAKELVLSQLNLTSAVFHSFEYDSEDGVYELEFSTDDKEYECEIDAHTGKVLKTESEPISASEKEDLDDDDLDDDDDHDDNDHDDDDDDRDDDDDDD